MRETNERARDTIIITHISFIVIIFMAVKNIFYYPERDAIKCS